MKKKVYIFLLSFLFLFAACNSEKKIVRYKGIYNEKPTYILIPQPIDKTAKKDETVNSYRLKRQNIEYNKGLKQAADYFYSSLFYPVANKGYYVIQEFSTQQIMKAEKIDSVENLTKTTLNFLQAKYGVDAVLFTYILAWKDDKQNSWDVFLDYQLRSAHTDSLMFQVRVKGQKSIPYSPKGIIKLLPHEKAIAKQMKISDPVLIQRVILLTRINEYIFGNLPFGQFAQKYEQDQNSFALGDCLEYFIDEDGAFSVQNIPLEKFEQECFIF